MRSGARQAALALTLGCALALCAPDSTAQPPNSQPCKLAVAEGYIEFRRAQFDRALQRFNEALGGSATCVLEARLGKAVTYNGLNDHKEALLEAQWVLGATEDPELLAEAQYQIGLGLHKRGARMTPKKAEAEAAFLRAAELSDGEHRGAVRALARIYRETQRDDDLVALQEQYDNVKVRSRAEQRKLMQQPRPPKPKTADAADEGAAAGPNPTYEELLADAVAGETRLCKGKQLPDAEQEILHFGGPDGAEQRGYAKPQHLNTPVFRYTDKARKERVRGPVILELLVGPEGDVLQVKVLRTLHPDLDASAIQGSCEYRFTPAETPDGEPIPATVLRTVNFNVS
ncbi:MAG: energy transducer TonB [Acidobacteriota bacterium]